MVSVILGDRHTAKTTKVIDWLLAGNPIPEYPGWSRAVVCPTHDRVLRITNEVRRRTEGQPDSRALWDLRKAIWSAVDLRSVVRGRNLSGTEYAIDDFDLMFYQVTGVQKPPTLITMTGDLYDDEA
jgi:hypothetical protein